MGLLKRIGVIAMFLAVAAIVVTDSGLRDLRSIAFADHNDFEDDDNEEATDRDEDDDDEEEELSGRQRCRERPFPAECRRRKKKQERREERGGGGDKKGEEGPTLTPAPTPSASPSPEPGSDCPLESVPEIGPALCELLFGTGLSLTGP